MKTENRFRFAFSLLLVCSFVLLTTCEKKKEEAAPLSINNVAGPNELTCGGFLWKVSYKLGKSSPKGGYIVQKVIIKRQTTKVCPTKYPVIDVTYWEAWKVDAGKDITTFMAANPKDYDDQYSAPEWTNSEGNHNNTGSLMFFEDLALPAGFVANNPKTYAGVLPSTDAEPPFWTEDGAVPHNINVIWDCCDETTSSMTTTPDFSVKPPEVITPKGGKFFENVEPIKAWTDPSGYSMDDNYVLLQNVMALSHLSDNEIITGVNDYASYYTGDLDAMSRLFVVLRVLYNVPDSVHISNAKSFGGWIRPASDLTGQYYHLLWPLGWDIDLPAPIVMNAYMGYVGAPYDPVGELQFFMPFGRRTAK